MRILGVGYCTMDHLGVVERFAEPDFKLEFEQFSLQGGGSAATAMVMLARLGMDVSFVGKVGDDSAGRDIVNTLAGEGISTEHVVYQKGGISQSSYIIVESSTGCKKTYFTRGTIEPLAPEEVSLDLLEEVDVLHVDATSPRAQLKLMVAARERGVTVVLDNEQPNPHSEELVANCDILVASERFASQLTGEGALEAMCRALLERGPSTVVVTLGDEGSVAMRREEGVLHRREAHPADVLDTTGAGDVFHGAFIYGIANDWPLDKSVAFANVAAGESCRTLGGRSVTLDVEALLSHV